MLPKLMLGVILGLSLTACGGGEPPGGVSTPATRDGDNAATQTTDPAGTAGNTGITTVPGADTVGSPSDSTGAGTMPSTDPGVTPPSAEAGTTTGVAR